MQGKRGSSKREHFLLLAELSFIIYNIVILVQPLPVVSQEVLAGRVDGVGGEGGEEGGGVGVVHHG